MKYGYSWFVTTVHTKKKPSWIERFFIAITGNDWWYEPETREEMDKVWNSKHF